jgi:hypothetical protein
LRTGDLVTVNPDGTYTFVARKKEVLRRRGQNLSPAEVENVVSAHPDVLEVAVVAVATELTEDEVKAFVVPRPGRSLDFDELRTWSAARLSAFKVPGSGSMSTHCRGRRQHEWPSIGPLSATHPRSTTPRTTTPGAHHDDPRPRMDDDRVPDVDWQQRRGVHPSAGT